MSAATPAPEAVGAALLATSLSIVAGIVLLWVLVCRLIARLSGWAALARAYPDMAPPMSDRRWRFRSGLMRFGSRYGNCLTLQVDHAGLRLSVLALLKPGHQPICVPWHEVSVRRVQRFFSELVELRFRSEPDIPLLIDAELAEELAEAAGASWPRESGSDGGGRVSGR
ncbi:MAG: hypothetical protein HY748_01845 [Elusimicrobia bacterium]|nr:hypothetical protein [Elusimicrobiota bacterium]